MKSKKFARNVQIWNWKYLCTALCVLRIRGVVYCRGILIIAIRIKALAPTLVAGITKWKMQLKTRPVTWRVFPVETIEFNYQKALEEANQSFSAMGDMPRHPLADRPYLIEESTKPGQLMPILEDEHGTYIMNSKDLRAVEHVERLAKIGIDSLKVEGRTKSLYYVARTAQVYRRAIDDAVAGRPFDPQLLGELNGLANRGYTDGFYQRHHTQDHQNYMEGVSQAHRSQYVGQVINVAEGWAEVEVKNRFAVGDQIEIISPVGNEIVTLSEMKNTDNQSINIIGGAGHKVRIPLAAKYEKALIAKML